MSAGALKIGLVSGGDRRQVAALEALPIDSLWVGGHIASRNAGTEVMGSLARLSAVTERVEIGTSVVVVPLYPPVLLAKQAADIDRATGGRLVLGIGVGGEYPQEFRAVEVPVNERGRRTDEAIPLMRKMWTAEEVTHHGRYFRIENVKIHPAPARPGGPPIVVAGRQEAAMRRAALLGDGWFPYLYSARRFASSVATVKDAAAAAGRSLEGFGWYVWVFTNVDPDGQQAKHEAATAIGGNYKQDFTAMLDNVAAAGTIDEVADKLKAYWDAGARHFVFSPMVVHGDRAKVVQRLVHDVVPRLREHAEASADVHAASASAV